MSTAFWYLHGLVYFFLGGGGGCFGFCKAFITFQLAINCDVVYLVRKCSKYGLAVEITSLHNFDIVFVPSKRSTLSCCYWTWSKLPELMWQPCNAGHMDILSGLFIAARFCWPIVLCTHQPFSQSRCAHLGVPFGSKHPWCNRFNGLTYISLYKWQDINEHRPCGFRIFTIYPHDERKENMRVSVILYYWVAYLCTKEDF